MSLVGGGDTCQWWEGVIRVTGGRGQYVSLVGGGRYVSLVGGGDTCHWWEGAIRVTGGRGRYVSLVGGGDTCH